MLFKLCYIQVAISTGNHDFLTHVFTLSCYFPAALKQNFWSKLVKEISRYYGTSKAQNTQVGEKSPIQCGCIHYQGEEMEAYMCVGAKLLQ